MDKPVTLTLVSEDNPGALITDGYVVKVTKVNIAALAETMFFEPFTRGSDGLWRDDRGRVLPEKLAYWLTRALVEEIERPVREGSAP